jgi:iron complex transport system ATP-binding protein
LAQAAMQQLGIGGLAARDYSRLSGGQRQLVLIARALAQDTPLIVMDEPTASLDFGNQAQVLAHIEMLARDANTNGRGVILSTHDPDQAFALNARVLLIHNGSVLADGPAAEVLSGENLSTVYGLNITVETTVSGRRVCLPSLRQSAPSLPSPNR